MTIKECIDLVDSLKPNQYSIKEKVMWLNFIEQVIINEVLKTHEGYDGRYDNFEGYSEDKMTMPMIVPSPYDRLYTQYLKMKIDEENGEVARYNNSATLYNTYMSEYKKNYNKTHMPIDRSKRKPAKHPTTTSASVTDAQLEGLKNELAYMLTNFFADSVSSEKIYDAVMNYMGNNAHLFKGENGKDGKDGEKGDPGYTPIKGIDYTDGKNGTNGRDGKDGEDGRTPIKGIDYFDGKDGKDGRDGEKGEDGYTPVKGIDYTDGRDGYTPVKGVDYFDGKDGKDGDKGEDGVSPIVNIVDTEEGQQIEITDKEGKKEFLIKNGGIIPDLNQNDETAPDYIKNRTHYETFGKNYGYTEFDLESTSMDVSDGTQTVSLTDPLEPGVSYPYKTDKGSGTFTVDFNYQYADGQVILGDTGYTGDYTKSANDSHINFSVGYDKEGYIQIGTPTSVKQLDEKYIPNSIARIRDVEAMIGIVNDELESILNGGVD
jgi:hypothetical protein